MNGLAGQGPGSGPGAVWDRPPSPTSDSSQQRASELFLLREALQSLSPSVAEAIARHVSCTNEALQKAEAERRSLMRSLTAAQVQLAHLPQMQVYHDVGVDVPNLPVLAYFTHSLTHSLTHPPTHPPTHSFVQSFSLKIRYVHSYVAPCMRSCSDSRCSQ